jgi:2-succinyl-5-enolpyruvyl-6-hydroxy-3-cyclohexene-1-carboxylate synthase
MSLPNRNALWAHILVDQLARSGVHAVCIAPGSRSTPLTIAFAQHPAIAVYRHLDERSAGFFALGLARAAHAPVALVCTSGSALVNFFPAIVEAHESRVPLIVLTGDRPPELRGSGANQTIDQIKIYGDYTVWFAEIALPEAQPDALTLRYLHSTAARAAAMARGEMGGRRGVVHLNIPFRKPLEPIPVPGDLGEPPLLRAADVPFTHVTPAAAVPPSETVIAIAGVIADVERGVIVCGTNTPGGDFPAQVRALAAHLGYPLFADPSSGVRFGGAPDGVTGGYETFLNDMGVPPAELIVRFGDVPTSKWLNEYLSMSGDAAYIQVSADGVWSDDLHRTSHFIHADPALWCAAMCRASAARRESAWMRAFARLEAETWAGIRAVMRDEDFDAAYVHDLIAHLPGDACLFVGNSLPIRHVDQFGQPRTAPLVVFANRGASGIDGNISTGLAIAAAHRDRPVTLLVGDITLFHDMNGLFALRDQRLHNVTIVLLNNDGGGIFQRLPIAGFDPVFTELFIMPHGLDFRHVAALYGLEYQVVNDRATFRALTAEPPEDRARLIEVRTETPHDETARRALIRRVRAHIRALDIFAETGDVQNQLTQ